MDDKRMAFDAGGVESRDRPRGSDGCGSHTVDVAEGGTQVGEVAMQIRQAVPEDADRVLRFWNDAGASVSATDEASCIRQATTNPAAVLVLALLDDEIVGSLLGTFDGWRGNMYRLVVQPARRRQGIGTRLVRHVEQVFAEWGVRRVTVLIEVDRPWAAAFWSAVGYPRDDRVVRHVGRLAGRAG